MANRIRGELALKLDGEVYTLCLTLGALAEIEAALGLKSLSELFARLAEGRLSSRDLHEVLSAALKGGGHEAAPLASLGVAECLAILAELMELTFGGLARDE